MIAGDNGQIKQKRLFIFLLGLSSLLLLLYAITTTNQQVIENSEIGLNSPSINDVTIRGSEWSHGSRGFLIDTPGCRIPDLPPSTKDTQKFFKKTGPAPKCSNLWSPLKGRLKQQGPPLVESNLTSMWVVTSSLSYYKVNNLSQLKCCYRPFWRHQQPPDNYNDRADNSTEFSKVCVSMSSQSATLMENITVEFVRVECSRVHGGKTDLVYFDFHAFVPVKPKIEERCSKIARKQNQLSVLVMGVDSVSRLNMLRQLPETHEVLQSLSATTLLGYNKVGDNTFPNLMPILTGLSNSEIRATCLRNQKLKVDLCPFIWNKFSERGFRTVYGEDCADMTTFNYHKTGFVEQPTDYYMRPYLYESLLQQGHHSSSSIKVCTGPRQSIQLVLDYINKFTSRFSKQPYFGLFWMNSASHNDLNSPHIADKLLADTLRELDRNEALQNTALFFISDHGIRWGEFRNTFQGRLEERLPLAYVYLPKWFQQQNPSAMTNLLENSRNRLTTPFDLHETLLDLLELDTRLQPPEVARPPGRGVSLFSPISPNRTCDQAEIAPHWCTCQTHKVITTTDSEIQPVINFVIQTINSKIASHKNCESLSLAKIHHCETQMPGMSGIPVKIQSELSFYFVVLETRPGGGVFEATVKKTVTKNNKAGVFELGGTISRLNMYGSQSECIDDATLKLYCYCKRT